MKINTPRHSPALQTHEGAPARHIPALARLRRSVSACLLWEDQFYEDGKAIAERIAELVKTCDPKDVAALAIEAREQFKLRHVPLLLLRELARHPTHVDKLLSVTMGRVIQRADELAEFLAIYWKDGKQPLSKQVKRGLAWALRKFNEYDLAKYNRDGAVKLRDVLFLSHAKPKDEAQAALWKRLAAGKLQTPDTWEVELSAGKDKRETFERLIREGKLGYLALLRNLRKMIEVKCDPILIEHAIRQRKGAERVLPFRFIAAARHAPQFEPMLDEAMQAAMAGLERLPGRTLVLVDNSGSMNAPISGKSDLQRTDAAAGLAILARGVAATCRVFSFANTCVEVPPRAGMALRDAISQTPSGGTYLGAAVTAMNGLPHDRLIVLTDEQSHDPVPNPVARGYMVNVASAKNGVGYGPWVHIDGWSESVMRFITEHEQHTVDNHVHME
jgi:60 kDa SS-A/Ro ribonucleoprotein